MADSTKTTDAAPEEAASTPERADGLTEIDGWLYNEDGERVRHVEEEEGFKVDDLSKADWVLKKHAAEMVMEKHLKDRESKVKEAKISAGKGAGFWRMRFGADLLTLVKDHLANVKAKSLELTHGKLGYRARKDWTLAVLDPKIADPYLSERFPEGVSITQVIDLSALADMNPEMAAEMQRVIEATIAEQVEHSAQDHPDAPSDPDLRAAWIEQEARKQIEAVVKTSKKFNPGAVEDAALEEFWTALMTDAELKKEPAGILRSFAVVPPGDDLTIDGKVAKEARGNRALELTKASEG